MKTLLGYAVLAAATFAVSPISGQAQNGPGECLINFDDTVALRNTYGEARSTFAVYTRPSSSEGRLESCSAEDVGCWIFRQRCSTNYVHLDEVSNYRHFHLSFTDPGFDGTCGFADPGDGYSGGMRKKVGTQCVTPDWGREPRFVNTHVPEHWLRLVMEDRDTREPSVFGMQTIRVGSPAPVELWFHNTRDEWWYWDELGPNWWDVSRWMQEVDLVYVRTADGYLDVLTIEDFHLRD